jgi:hypothetical protein
MTKVNSKNETLPQVAQDYIGIVVKKIRYRVRVRDEVGEELVGHFIDALAGCENETDRKELAENLIEEFGDAQQLAKLIRHGKKRCRPWWRKVFGQTCRVMLVLWVITIPYNFWSIQSWRAHAGKYLEQFNALNRPALASAQNAWPDYQKAHISFVEHPQELTEMVSRCSSSKCSFEKIAFDDLSIERMEIFKQWLLDNDPTWTHIIKATNVEHYWWDLQGFLNGANGSGHEIMEHTRLFRPIARMGRLRALHQAEHGQIELSLENSIVLVKMGFHLSKSTTLLEHMIGVAILNLGVKTVIEVASGENIEKQLLVKTQKALEELYRIRRIHVNPQGEYLYAIGNIGNALGLTNANSYWKSLFPGHFFFIGNRKAVGNKVLPNFGQIGLKTPYELHVSADNKVKKKRRFPIPVYLIDNITHAMEHASERDFRVRALYESTLTILALKRWQIERGEYPQRLEELVIAGLLQELPDDPYSNGSLIYEKRDDDFILYCIGADFEDNGGIKNSDALWGDGEAGGDHIFWPVLGVNL